MIEVARAKGFLGGLFRACSRLQVNGFEIGLLAYILIPPLGWLIVAGWPQEIGRFGMQWQVLGLGIAFASLFALADNQSLRAYFCWLNERKVVSFLFLGNLWLAVMGFVHGFIGLQLEGLLSGVLFLNLFPAAWFAWGGAHVAWKRVFIFCILFLLVFEDICLSFSMWRGLGFGVEILEGPWYPRLFLNIRDGNTIAVGASVAAFALVTSRQMRWLGFCLMTAVFYNGWITAGRGLFASVWFGVSVALFCAFAGACRARWMLSVLLICLTALACSWMIYFVCSMLAGVDSDAFQSMIGRLANDAQFGRYGRLFIWTEWIRGGLSQNFFFGSGLGIRPVILGEPVFTPHNLFVQLLAEGGILSFMLIVFAFVWLASRFLGVRGDGYVLIVYCFGSLLVWLSVSAVLFWPAGVWLISNLGSVFAPENSRRFVAVGTVPGLRGLLVALFLMPLLVVFVSKKLAIWY